MDAPIFDGDEGANLNFAFDDEAQSNGLHAAGGQALSVLTVDSPVPEGLLEKVRVAIDADLLREIDIVQN